MLSERPELEARRVNRLKGSKWSMNATTSEQPLVEGLVGAG
jgi:hypothetical protein